MKKFVIFKVEIPAQKVVAPATTEVVAEVVISAAAEIVAPAAAEAIEAPARSLRGKNDRFGLSHVNILCQCPLIKMR